MRFRKASLLCACLALPVLAGARLAGDPGTAYTPDQLDQLLGPVALYPDPLVALILPASTVPTDITLAAGYLSAGGDPAAIDSQSWDPSVKGLAHYPEVLQWMAANLDWTQAVGAAFAQQPDDVMKAIQQLRAQALALGTLVNTPQQRIDVEGDDIRIVPAQQDAIYVPEYDPDVVYDVPGGVSGPYVTFGSGYPVGAWLGYQCDWDDFGIWVAPWHPGWAYDREWRTPGASVRRWQPDRGRAQALARNYFRPGGNPPRPEPIARPAGPPRPRAPAPRAPSPRTDYRGWAPQEAPRPSTPAPPSALFGGYGRGTEVRTFSDRGQESRQAPVRAPARTEAPSRAPAPSGGGDRDRR
jgi:hypothetical protein